MENKRLSLFNRYAQNFNLYFPEANDIFVCPLCRRIYGRDSLQGPIPRVSLAHIISKELGGKTCTLSCTQCNNWFGREVETHLVKNLELRPDLSGKIRLSNVRMEGPFGNIGVEMEVSSDPNSGHNIFVIDKQSNPVKVATCKEFLWDVLQNQKESGFKLFFRTRMCPKRTNVAFYHAAFLLMFHYFGYEYVLDPCADLIRKQRFNPDEENFPPQVVVPGNLGHSIWSQNSRWGVMLLQNPAMILTFFRMKPNRGPELTVAIPLPKPGSRETPTIEEGTEFQGQVIPFMPDVTLSEKWTLHNVWQAIAGKPG